MRCLRKQFISLKIRNLLDTAHWFPKATKNLCSFAFWCDVYILWVNTVRKCLLFCCTPSPFVPSTRLFTRVPGEQILELFNLHYCFIGGKQARYRLNVSASLNPLSKARCCWCGSSRFKDAFTVLSVQSSKYAMAVQGYVFAVMWIFLYIEDSFSAWVIKPGRDSGLCSFFCQAFKNHTLRCVIVLMNIYSAYRRPIDVMKEI